MKLIRNLPNMSEFYTRAELLDLGFSSVGENVCVSRQSRLYAISGRIGDDSRVDDFTILKGHIEIGKKVHICSHCSLSGVGGKIVIGDLSGVGVNNIFYTASDDMLRAALCGPLVDRKYTSVKCGDIELGVGVALGSRVTVMPNVSLGDFCAVGIGAVLIGKMKANSVYMVVKGKLKRVASRNADLLDQMAGEELVP